MTLDLTKIRFGTTDRAEIFTRSISRQDHSLIKISARKDEPKLEIVCEDIPPPPLLRIRTWQFFYVIERCSKICSIKRTLMESVQLIQ